MKSRHRVPTMQTPPHGQEVTPEYQAEVDRTTESAQRRYRIAEQRLAAAERKAEQLQGQKVKAAQQRQHKRDLATAMALVELRRGELEELARMMQTAPATAGHRGRKSYRPVPPTESRL